jgi:XapX domain-containing protein
MPDTLKTIIGVALAFAIGAACRWIDIPVPAPNKLIGAVLVVAVTLGYLAADRALPALPAGALPAGCSGHAAAESAAEPNTPPRSGQEQTRDGAETAAGE